MKKGVSIVVPAYDEVEGIEPVLDRLRKVAAGLGEACEIIVVDDGSRDGTGERLEGRKDIRLLRHASRRGYGAALKTGIREARYDLIGITDADGTYPNERIPDLAGYLRRKDLDMVVGARTGADAKIPLVRRPAKWAIGKLASMVAGEAIPDPNSGLRVFRRDVLLRFFAILPDGFSFTTTITLGMISNGYRVEYLPIDYHRRTGRSKIRPLHDTANFVLLILRMGLYFAPIKIFFPLAAFIFLLATAWGIFSKFVLGAFADDSTLLIVLSSLQVGVVGLLAELVNRRLPTYGRDREADEDGGE